MACFWAVHASHFHSKSPAWHGAVWPLQGCFHAFVELYARRIMSFIDRGKAPTVKVTFEKE